MAKAADAVAAGVAVAVNALKDKPRPALRNRWLQPANPATPCRPTVKITRRAKAVVNAAIVIRARRLCHVRVSA